MHTTFLIATGNDDVSMIASREKLSKVYAWVICIIQQKQPLLALSRKPVKCIIGSLSYSSFSHNIFKTRLYSLDIAGVNVVDSPETTPMMNNLVQIMRIE